MHIHEYRTRIGSAGDWATMNRSHAFDLCEHLLNLLCLRVETRSKLNLLNLNIHCEDFFAQLLNLILGCNLKNTNATQQNAEGVDLVDADRKMILQVSSTATKGKVNSALSKDLDSYNGYNFKFVAIIRDAAHLRKIIYEKPSKISFDPEQDIYDIPALHKLILHMELSKQREIYEFLQRELNLDHGLMLEESNIAEIIRIISNEDLSKTPPNTTIVPFNVDDKIEQNNLKIAANFIDDYAIHHHRVQAIYGQFDLAGRNKSRSVLDSFRAIYLNLSVKINGDDLYFQIIEHIIRRIKASSNYSPLPLDELELYVNIIAVDAFIRCKIFKEPKKKINATA
jgi:hypothetical protein